jgi:ElaB/YqjD/DUF883 family membrane-anchored ribosome-binding protein
LAIFFESERKEAIMETSENITGINGPGATAGLNGVGAPATVQKVAQKAHEAVDKLEQTLGSGTQTVMGWQQEYGEMAREQVRANPLTVVAGAFAVGFLFAKLMR